MLFLLRARVGRRFDAVCGIAQDKAVQLGGFKHLPHGQQDLVLEALRPVGYAGHHGPDMYGLDLPQLHAAQRGHDMVVVAGAVHFDGSRPQVLLVGGEPDFCPLAHKGAVANGEPGLIVGAQRLLGCGQLGQRAAVNDLLPPV